MPRTHTLHSVENLGPMCRGGRGCNQEKGNAVEAAAGAIYIALDKAAKKAYDVNMSIQGMRAARGIDRALLQAMGDKSGAIEKALRKHGPQLAERIHSVDEGLLEQFTSIRELTTGIDAGFIPDFMVEGWTDNAEIILDSRGRLAYRIAKQAFDTDLDRLFVRGLRSVAWELEQRVNQVGLIEEATSTEFELVGPRHMPLNPVVTEFGNGRVMELCLKGEVTSEHNSSYSLTDQNGRLGSGQTTVSVEGRFVIRIVFREVSDNPQTTIDVEDVSVTKI
jgi:hypothetical protein